MARCRLILVLAASCLLTALAKQASSADSAIPSSLFCVTFVKPNTKEIILNVEYSHGTHNVTMNLHDNYVRNDTDLLTVKVVKLQHSKFLLNMSYGECAVTCLHTPDGEAENIARPSNEEVLCEKGVLQPFESNENYDLCTIMSKSTDQQSGTTFTPDLRNTSSTSNSPHTTNETPLATEETPIPPTPSTPPGPAVALLVVLVVEVVASIILSAVAVMVVRDARNTTITPATTTVRRASTHDLYVCENDLYEPFPSNTAAEQEEEEEEEEEEKKKKEKKVVLKFRSITKKQKKRTNEEGKQD